MPKDTPAQAKAALIKLVNDIIKVDTNAGRKPNLRGRDLSGFDFKGLDLKGADFTDAILTNTDFTGADLTGANFTNATLVEAELGGARLHRADFRGTTLNYTNFTGADLTGANFRKTIFTSAEFGSAILNGADFTDAKPQSTNFAGASFIGTDLRNTDLKSATFIKADPNGGADIYANFTDAQLTGTKICISLKAKSFEEFVNIPFIKQFMGDGTLRVCKNKVPADQNQPRVFELVSKDHDIASDRYSEVKSFKEIQELQRERGGHLERIKRQKTGHQL